MDKLKKLHEILLDMPSNSLTDALFIIVDHMVEAGDGDISFSADNIGIVINKNVVEVVDIEASRSIAQFALTNDKVTI